MKWLANAEFDQTAAACDTTFKLTSRFPKLIGPTLRLAALVLSSLIARDASAALLPSTTPLTRARGSQTATPLSDLISLPLYNLPPGHLLATVFVNGIPSSGKIFRVPPVSFVANSANQLSSMLLPSFGPGGVTLTCAGVQGVSYYPAPPAGNAFYRATCP
jgi:hypothetical protein